MNTTILRSARWHGQWSWKCGSGSVATESSSPVAVSNEYKKSFALWLKSKLTIDVWHRRPRLCVFSVSCRHGEQTLQAVDLRRRHLLIRNLQHSRGRLCHTVLRRKSDDSFTFAHNSRLSPPQRLLQVLNQIVRMFQSNGEPQQVRRAARVRTLDGSAVLNEAVRTAEAGGVGEDLHRTEHLERFGPAAFHLHRHQPTKAAEHLA